MRSDRSSGRRRPGSSRGRDEDDQPERHERDRRQQERRDQHEQQAQELRQRVRGGGASSSPRDEVARRRAPSRFDGRGVTAAEHRPDRDRQGA